MSSCVKQQRSFSCVPNSTKLVHPKDVTRERKEAFVKTQNEIRNVSKRYSLPSNRHSNSGHGRSYSFMRRRSTSVPSRSSSQSSLREVDDNISTQEPDDAVNKYEPEIWQEFIKYILSINADIWSFDAKHLETRVPSTDYNTALNALPKNLKGKPRPKQQHHQTSRNKKRLSCKNDDNKINKSRSNSNTETLLDLEDLKDNLEACENLSPIPESSARTEKGKVSNDAKAVKESRKKSNVVETDAIDDMKESKWEVVRNDIQEQQSKKLVDSSIEGWDKLAQAVGTLGTQTTSRQYLYKKYIDRPNDWRRGLSPTTSQKYDYVFTEAECIRKEYKWRNKKGKLPRLQERLRERDRPKTTPQPGRRSYSRLRSSGEYSSGEEDWGDVDTYRPTTAP